MQFKPLSVTVLAVIGICTQANLLQAENWPGWRGPQQNGLSNEVDVPVRWSETENVHWRIQVPGDGHSSPIVWENSIFVTTSVADDLSRRLIRVDRETGNIVWNHVVATGPAEKMHRDNTSASATPVTDGKIVYVSFCVDGKLLVAAYSFGGELIWLVEPGTFASEHGYSTGLVLDDKRLILSGLQDGEDAFVAALDKSSGKVLWKVKPEHNVRSFSTPFMCEIDQQPAILLSGAEQTVAYNRISGSVLFKVDGPASKTVSSIVTCPTSHLAFVCGGRDKQLFAIKLNDVLNDANASPSKKESRIAWRATKAIPYMNSPLLSSGFLHVMSDEGIYRCYRATDGEVLQERRAVGPVKASMVATANRIYITETCGKTTVIENSPSWNVLAVNNLSSEVVASPAISNGDFIVRTRDSLFLIRDSRKPSDP